MGVSVGLGGLVVLLVAVCVLTAVGCGLAAVLESWSAYTVRQQVAARRMAERKGGCAVRIIARRTSQS